MALLVFVSFVGVFYSLVSLTQSRKRMVAERVHQIRQGRREQPPLSVPGANGKRLKAALFRVGERVHARMTPKAVERMAVLLGEAGYPMSMRVVDFLGLRVLCSLLGATCGLAFATMVGSSRGVLLFVVCALLGWRGPTLWLSRIATRRKGDIARKLPSALDLLTISVEAGLGFDQALGRVAEKFEGPVRDEFSRTIREIQLGSTRAEAMQRLGTRAGVDALRLFSSAIIQADKLGSPLARTLRIQSDSMRERQRVDAQERALKAPVKMLIPLVLFVFPSVFIVVLGPAMIHLVQMFSKGGL